MAEWWVHFRRLHTGSRWQPHLSHRTTTLVCLSPGTNTEHSDVVFWPQLLIAHLLRKATFRFSYLCQFWGNLKPSKEGAMITSGHEIGWDSLNVEPQLIGIHRARRCSSGIWIRGLPDVCLGQFSSDVPPKGGPRETLEWVHLPAALGVPQEEPDEVTRRRKGFGVSTVATGTDIEFHLKMNSKTTPTYAYHYIQWGKMCLTYQK